MHSTVTFAEAEMNGVTVSLAVIDCTEVWFITTPLKVCVPESAGVKV
jgi:hypothetical protein